MTLFVPLISTFFPDDPTALKGSGFVFFGTAAAFMVE